MGIMDEREDAIRKNPKHGVTFSIEPEAYECNLGEDRVCFGESYTYRMSNCGTFINHQPILIDGVNVGYLREISPWNIFEPMQVTFIYPLDENNITREMRKSPHFFEDEDHYLQTAMHFATLQQFTDYVTENLKQQQNEMH